MAKTKAKTAAKPKSAPKKAAPKKVAQEPIIPMKKLAKKIEPALPVEDLLTKLNGFEGAVAEVKHLKSKAATNPENKLLARELKAKLEAINVILKSISKVIC